MFVDYVKIAVTGGDGGDGAVAFLRAKYRPRGGPAGGNGGRGGGVIFAADPKLGTLLDLRYKRRIEAQRGGHGSGKTCHGRNGDDVIIRVPVGTVIGDEAGGQLADLTEPGQRWTAARGGGGGLGNAHFATPTNKTPRFATPGRPGEERDLVVELKLIADVGLVGLPNAGKSTLLSKLTAATPKIASYPFTTLTPHLGVIECEDFHRFTLADIPGLIKGASQGAGLGDRFLRHIERTRLLAHLVADDEGEFDPERMLARYAEIRRELEAHGASLPLKPELVVVTKIDLAKTEGIEKACLAFRQRGLEVVAVSALTGEGLDALRQRLRERLEELG